MGRRCNKDTKGKTMYKFMTHLRNSVYWRKGSGKHDILKALDSDHVCETHFTQAQRKRFKGVTGDCSIVITDAHLEIVTSDHGPNSTSVQESNPVPTLSSQVSQASALADSSSSSSHVSVSSVVRRKLAEDMVDDIHRKAYEEEMKRYIESIISVTLGSSYNVSIAHEDDQITQRTIHLDTCVGLFIESIGSKRGYCGFNDKFQLDPSNVRMQPYYKVAKHIRDSCPVKINVCSSDDSNCEAHGHCASTGFKDIALVMVGMYWNERITRFTYEQKALFINDMLSESEYSKKLFGNWKPDYEMIVMCWSGDACQTSSGDGSLLRASLCFINDGLKVNSGRGEYLHHVSATGESKETIRHHYGDIRGYPFTDVAFDDLPPSFVKEMIDAIVNPIKVGGITYCILVVQCADQPYQAKVSNRQITLAENGCFHCDKKTSERQECAAETDVLSEVSPRRNFIAEVDRAIAAELKSKKYEPSEEYFQAQMIVWQQKEKFSPGVKNTKRHEEGS